MCKIKKGKNQQINNQKSGISLGMSPENKPKQRVEQLTCSPHGMQSSYLDESPVDKYHHTMKTQLHKSGQIR